MTAVLEVNKLLDFASVENSCQNMSANILSIFRTASRSILAIRIYIHFQTSFIRLLIEFLLILNSFLLKREEFHGVWILPMTCYASRQAEVGSKLLSYCPSPFCFVTKMNKINWFLKWTTQIQRSKLKVRKVLFDFLWFWICTLFLVFSLTILCLVLHELNPKFPLLLCGRHFGAFLLRMLKVRYFLFTYLVF